MKKFSKQIAVGVLVAFLIFLSGAYVLFTTQKDSAPHRLKIAQQATMLDADTIRPLEELYGVALAEDKQAFEDLIKELLMINPDDKAGGFASRTDIDMLARKKYFSADSYLSYIKYVDQQKGAILSLGVDSGATYTCRALFKRGSQKYIEDAHGSIVFTVNGQFLCGAWDASASNGRYELKIKTKSDVTNPSNLQIDAWEINILEPVQRKSPQKNGVGVQ